MMGLATGAFAQSEYQTPRLDSMLSNALFSTNGETTIGSAPRVEAMYSNALAAASGPIAGSEKHQLGVGIRIGGSGFGIGGGIKAFFGGPIGVQLEVQHFGGVVGYGFTDLQAAVLYRLNDIKLDAPLVLTPYVGGGLDYVNTSYVYSSNTGAVILGGVEAFIGQVPEIGISVQFSFTTNDFGGVFGGAGGTLGVHWYFK